MGVLDTIHALRGVPESPARGLVRAELQEKTSGEYGSLVRWLLVFLDD